TGTVVEPAPGTAVPKFTARDAAVQALPFAGLSGLSVDLAEGPGLGSRGGVSGESTPKATTATAPSPMTTRRIRVALNLLPFWGDVASAMESSLTVVNVH